MSINRIASTSACVFSLLASFSVSAATWQPVGGVHNGTSLHPLYPFQDGVPTVVNWDTSSTSYQSGSIDGEWVLANSSDPSHTSYLFSFGGPFGTAPAATVDWMNHTIDVSGMYFHGVNPLANTGSGKFDGWIFEQMIGWSVAPSEWHYDPYSGAINWMATNPLVPFTDNGNGTYTANWSYANNVMGFGYTLDHMALTFQSVSSVPLPAPIWLFLSGLGTLAVRVRNKRNSRCCADQVPAYHS